MIDLQKLKKHAREENVTDVGFRQNKQVCSGFLFVMLKFVDFVLTYDLKAYFPMDVF